MLARDDSEVVDSFIRQIPKRCPRPDCGQPLARDLSEISVGRIYFTCRLCSRRIQVFIPRDLLPVEWRTTTVKLVDILNELKQEVDESHFIWLTKRTYIDPNNPCDVCKKPLERDVNHRFKKRHLECKNVAVNKQKYESDLRHRYKRKKRICPQCNKPKYLRAPIVGACGDCRRAHIGIK